MGQMDKAEQDREKGKGLPQAFRQRMKAMLGEEYEAFMEAIGEGRCQALRLNPLKLREGGKTARQVLGEVADPEPEKVPWADHGYYYTEAARPGRHPYHQAGLYYIQEPSAMMPAELLEPRPGERILDLCAAPGGKSTQIAGKMEGKGFLLCNEIHPARAKILSENIERLGIRNACVSNEEPKRLAEVFPEYFDRILVDAPCSGEGMFRKNQEACGEWSPENVDMCAARQDQILDCAGKMLRPGGRLVYSTCTFSWEENEGSIDRFLAGHPEYRILPVSREGLGLTGCDGLCGKEGEKGLHLEGIVRMWPQRIKGEGHFAAVLEKNGTWPEGYRKAPACGVAKGIPLKELGEYMAFCQENLRVPEAFLRGEGCYMGYGENLYLVPGDMPSMRGLRILRAGLHVGERKKNRFEPSHALALALSPADVAHTWDLPFTSSEGEVLSGGTADSRELVAAYLRGQTFPAEGEKGWYLVCVDGFSLGWGKLAGGIMKNHYPRGLRIQTSEKF